jgi:hypothetical protein
MPFVYAVAQRPLHQYSYDCISVTRHSEALLCYGAGILLMRTMFVLRQALSCSVVVELLLHCYFVYTQLLQLIQYTVH